MRLRLAYLVGILAAVGTALTMAAVFLLDDPSYRF